VFVREAEQKIRLVSVAYEAITFVFSLFKTVFVSFVQTNLKQWMLLIVWRKTFAESSVRVVCVFVFSLRLDQLGLWPRWIKLPSSGSRGQSLRVNEWRNCTLPSIGHHSAPHSLTKSGDVHYFLLFLLNTGKQTIILSVSHQNWIVESFNRAVVFAGTVISEFSCKGIHRLCSVHTNWFFFCPGLINGLNITFSFPGFLNRILDFWA